MSDNAEIVIGAKNTASKVLEDVGKSTSMLAKRFSTLVTAGAAIGGVVLAAKAIGSAFSSVSGFVDDFDRETESVAALARAIDLAGESSKLSIAGHQAMADSLEKLVNIESDVTMGLMRQASMLGVADKQLDSVAKAAIGLSQAMGIELEDALKKARLATEGHFESFNKILPTMKDMATNEEKLTAVMEIATKGLKDKEAASLSAAHSGERANISLGNLQETIGRMLSPIRELSNTMLVYLTDAIEKYVSPAIDKLMIGFSALDPIFSAMGNACQTFGAVFGQAIESAVNVMGTFAEAIVGNGEIFKWWGDALNSVTKWVSEFLIGSITFWEVSLTNLSAMAEISFAKIELTYIQLAEATKHFFTEVIPAYFEWFTNNAWEILTNGFEANLKSIPDIMARELTSRETELTAAIGLMADNLGAKFTARWADGIRGLGDSTKKELDKSIDLMMDGASPDEKEKKDKADKTAKVRGKHSEGGTIQATESRLLTRGANSNPMLTALEKNTKAVEENTKAERYKKYNPDGSPLGNGMQIEFVN